MHKIPKKNPLFLWVSGCTVTQKTQKNTTLIKIPFTHKSVRVSIPFEKEIKNASRV